MGNLYYIELQAGGKFPSGYHRCLSWTAAPNPRRAWTNLIECWSKFYEGDTREAKIKQARKRDGARLRRVSVPGKVH